MKALVVSDVVSEVLYSPEVRCAGAGVDVVLSCGDLPYEYLEYIVSVLDAPLFYVRGNHDGRLLRSDGRESFGPDGGRSIDGRLVRIGGKGGTAAWVAGFGGSGPYCGGGYERSERDMSRSVRRIATLLGWRRLVGDTRLDVVVSHAAPRGMHDAEDPCHRGFECFLRLMRSRAPRLWLHGHVHPSYGIDLRPLRVGETEVRGVYGYEIVEIG